MAEAFSFIQIRAAMSCALHNRAPIFVLASALYLFCCGNVTPAEDGFTLFGWSDQHVGTNGELTHLLAAVDAMNELPGTALPDAIGGKVATPAMKKWIIRRHGGLSYTFDHGGVHFIGLFSAFDPDDKPAQPLTDDALAFLRKDLEQTPAGTPIVAATHLCFDAITNRDALIEAFGDANVILMLGGHYHKSTAHRYRGFNFVQFASPRDQTEVTVVRISPERLVAIPYDHSRKRWSDEPGKTLDVPIRGPRKQPSAQP